MTSAERQRASRQRRQAAAEAQRTATLAAYARPEGKPTKDVLAALGMYMDNLNDPAKAVGRDTDRESAWRAICELCSRCGIKPPPKPAPVS
jgi:hypothetical protein